jgi:hypothetical protein
MSNVSLKLRSTYTTSVHCYNKRVINSKISDRFFSEFETTFVGQIIVVGQSTRATAIASSSSFLTYLLHFLEVENREREQININSLTAY